MTLFGTNPPKRRTGRLLTKSQLRSFLIGVTWGWEVSRMARTLGVSTETLYLILRGATYKDWVFEILDGNEELRAEFKKLYRATRMSLRRRSG